MTKQTNTKYRIRNPPEYNNALVNRKSITIWFSDEAMRNGSSHIVEAARLAYQRNMKLSVCLRMAIGG